MKGVAVFLDRDGVLIEDVHLLTRNEQLRVLPGVPEALRELKDAGFKLVVISNQPVVARGLVSEEDVRQTNRVLEESLVAERAPRMDGWYFCPHHPHATLEAYRSECICRKPRAGLFQQAAAELQLDFAGSFTIGDRITDIIAGASVGCRTILVQSGKHLDPPIVTSELLDTSVKPDHTCQDLAAAAAWILRNR